MSSKDIFLDWFKEYYSHEFLSIPKETKDELIEKIVLNNGEYITKEMITNFDGCVRCGRCCINQRCPHIDKETMLCSRHDNPIDPLCIDYPWTGELGVAPITINCSYQVSFFISYFDHFFEEYVKRGAKNEE